VEEERERAKGAQDEQDVEGHRAKAISDDPDAAADMARRETDDESDVEAHRAKA
jgi:hypothetical protein